MCPWVHRNPVSDAYKRMRQQSLSQWSHVQIQCHQLHLPMCAWVYRITVSDKFKPNNRYANSTPDNNYCYSAGSCRHSHFYRFCGWCCMHEEKKYGKNVERWGDSKQLRNYEDIRVEQSYLFRYPRSIWHPWQHRSRRTRASRRRKHNLRTDPLSFIPPDDKHDGDSETWDCDMWVYCSETAVGKVGWLIWIAAVNG